MLLVIGYGNPLRCDDGVGQVVARRLADQLQRDDLRVIACHQLTPELVEPISRADRVIFIDASVTGQPGQITCCRVDPAPVSPGALLHHVSPSDLLAGAAALYNVHPNGLLITITGADFGYGESLSQQVDRAADRVTDQIKNQMSRISSGTQQNTL